MLNRLSLRGSVAVSSPGNVVVAPTTNNYTYAQAGSGLTGSISTTKTAGKVYFYALKGAWVGYITGTEALLTAFQNTSTTPAGMIEVSIDGGAWTVCSQNATRYVLFTGLPHARRLVMVRGASAYSSTVNVNTTGTMLSVTGAPPSIETATTWLAPGDGNANTFNNSSSLTANATNFTPPLITNTGSNVPMVVLKGSFTRIWVAGHYTHCYISIDGGTPTRYQAPRSGTPTSANFQANLITGLSGTHTYYVWGSHNLATGGGNFCVGVESALSAVTVTRRIDQFGDSITYGASATSPGDVDLFRVATGMGMAASTCAISGYTIAQLLALLPTDLAGRTVTSNDVAILAIGRNNTGGAFDAQETTDYTACVQALINKGYGKIICRSILRSALQFPAENASIQSIVTGFANPNVVFLDAELWWPYTTSDGTHPTDAGYITIAGFAASAYPSLV